MSAPSRSWSPSVLLHSVSRLEWVVAAVVAGVLGLLVLLEPSILEAPFENARTLAFTIVGTLLAGGALILMLHFGIPPALRVVVLLVPFVAVTWWLVSPFFIDERVDDEFAVSIADAETTTSIAAPTTTTAAEGEVAPSTTAPPPTAPPVTAAPAPTGPILRGSGSIVGLAGHSGSGQVGVFALESGLTAVRFEGINIQNGPDLQVYVVPGAGARDPIDGSLYLGGLRGNVGDITYELPAGTEIPPGDWTVLVWCEAFSVEFVGADVTVT